MSKLSTAVRLLRNNKSLFFVVAYDYFRRKGYFNIFSDTTFIRLTYFFHFGRFIHLKKPRTFNEKLNWLKIHNRKDIFCQMVDKFDAKKYVAERIGEQYIIKTIGLWEKVEDIDFDLLPSKFVIKCTHDSSDIIICKDKKEFDLQMVKTKLSKGLSKNLFYWGREWPYLNLKPRIIAEELLEAEDGDLRDYKFFCFNGEVKCFKIDFDRFINHGANYYDCSGNLLPFGEVVCPPNFDKKIEMPSRLNDMILLAGILSNGLPFLRVDFYEVCGKIFFGELTFYPASGFGKFTDYSWDEKLGNWIKLN